MISESHFHGRGRPGDRDGEYMHLAEPGFVYSISLIHGKQAYVWGFSRMFLMDEWGLCVSMAFRRVSTPGLTSSWAEFFADDEWIYRPCVIQLIREEGWMCVEG